MSLPQKRMDRGEFAARIIGAVSGILDASAQLEQAKKELSELLSIDGYQLAKALEHPPWLCDGCEKPTGFLGAGNLCGKCATAKKEEELRAKVRAEFLLTEKKESGNG